MENHGDDDAGETIAVRSKTEPMMPSSQEIVAHEARGYYPSRDWCRACVGGAGRSDAHTRQQEEQDCILVASMGYGFFSDGQEQTSKGDGDITRDATPFWVAKVMPSTMIRSMLVHCKSVELRQREKTVESLNRLGYPELIVRSNNEPAMRAFRDTMIKELKERCGVRAIEQALAKYDPASAGMVENAVTCEGEGANTGDSDS